MLHTTLVPIYKGAIEALYVQPPEGSAVVCLDEMGPEAAKSWPGQRAVVTAPRQEPSRRPAGRARQEIDYGRRESGYVFGAFCPATGDAFTAPYAGRTIANWVDFLERVDGWLPATVGRVYAVLDNLSTHRAVDVLLFQLTHPRWEFVFQPTYAAYLNLIEPWWKILRYWPSRGVVSRVGPRSAGPWRRPPPDGRRTNIPFSRGQPRRHRPRRAPGIARLPAVA